MGVTFRAACSRPDLFHGRRLESFSIRTGRACSKIFPPVRGYFSAGLVPLARRRYDSLDRTHCRAFVILGLRLRDALIALCFVLAIVTFGHLLREPLYDLTGHVIPRLVLLLFVFWCPREHDRFSVDFLLARRKAEPANEGN